MTEDMRILEAVSRFSTAYIEEIPLSAERVPRELLMRGGRETLKRVRLETGGSNRQSGAPKDKRRFIAATAACAAASAVIAAVIVFAPGSGGPPVAYSTQTPAAASPSAKDADNGIIIAVLNDGHITVRENKKAKKAAVLADFALLQEDEVFVSDTSVIRGTITDIQYIEVTLNGTAPDGTDAVITQFYGIVSLRVKDCLRGEEEKGDMLKILVHNLVNKDFDGWIEDTEIISQVREGMDVIFMPKKLSEEDSASTLGVTLRLKDLADYVLPDTIHGVILDTGGGLVYAKWAYEGMDETSLDSAQEYVRDKLAETAPIWEHPGTDLYRIFDKSRHGKSGSYGLLKKFSGSTVEMETILKGYGRNSDDIEALTGHTIWYEDGMYYYFFDSGSETYGKLIDKIEK